MPTLAGRISEERVGDDGEQRRKPRRDQGPEHQRLQPVARRRSKGQRSARERKSANTWKMTHRVSIQPKKLSQPTPK